MIDIFELDFGEFKFDRTHVHSNTTYTKVINPDGDFQIGIASSAQFKFDLNALYENLPLIQGKEFKLIVNGEQKGIFIAEKPEKKSENIVSVVSYDRMRYFDKLIDGWLETISFPVTLFDLLKLLCIECGVETENTNILNGDYVIESKPVVNNATALQILKWICELSACFAVINAQGNLELRWYSEKNVILSEEEYVTLMLSGVFNIDNADYITDKIEHLRISSTKITTVIPEGVSRKNVYIVQSNPLLITSDQNELERIGNNIYNAIKDMSYVPFKLSVPRQSTDLNAGDVITVKPRKGGEFQAYIMSYIATGTSFYKFEAGATGNKTRDTQTDTIANQLINNNQFITQIIDVTENTIIVSDTAQILNCWIDEMNVQYLETNFQALNVKVPLFSNERNFVRIVNQEISYINAVLSETETENYITQSGHQIFWTSINIENQPPNPQAYKYFTITDPITVQPGANKLTDDEKEAIRELFRVKVRKTLSENHRKVSAFDENHPLKIPKDFWGQGNEHGNGRGMIYKELDGFYLTYTLRNPLGELSAGTEIGIKFTDDGVQFFDINDGKWKTIGVSINEKIEEYSTRTHTNIHCIHESTEENVLHLRVEDTGIKRLPEYGCYQFTLRTPLTAVASKISIMAADGDLLTGPKEWLLTNMSPVTNNDVLTDTRVQILDNGNCFFSNASGNKDNESFFQLTVAKKSFTNKLYLSNCVAMRAEL